MAYLYGKSPLIRASLTSKFFYCYFKTISLYLDKLSFEIPSTIFEITQYHYYSFYSIKIVSSFTFGLLLLISYQVEVFSFPEQMLKEQ